jgi:hypothetical protein
MIEKTHYVMFNGPPGCGKDTLTRMYMTRFEGLLAQETYRVGHAKAAWGMKNPVHEFLAITHYSEEQLEKMKDLPSDWGPTLREAYIGFSEKFAKPVFGEDIFGRILERTIDQWKRYIKDVWEEATTFVVCCSDAGFQAEQQVLVKTFGAHNCILVHVKRPGHDFTKDSRSYLRFENVETYELVNDGDLNMLRHHANRLFKRTAEKWSLTYKS